MRFKKIYIEITNICNMNCSFCPPHNREHKNMSLESFNIILEKIKPYTKFIYLHVKGEPMLHPNFKEMVKTAYEKGFFVNITTNGTLLKDNLDITKYIRQLNISLHATNNQEIIKTAKRINDCYVNFRVWNADDIESNETTKLLEKEFNIDISKELQETMQSKKHYSMKSETNFTLKNNFYVSIQNQFSWPDLTQKDIDYSKGYCHALRDHIAILVDGTIVPCCLDNNGDITLGNVFNEELEKIISSPRAINIVNGFRNRVCVEELCKKCEYKNRF